MTEAELYGITPDSYGWRRLPNGNQVRLGNKIRIGKSLVLGDGVALGDGVVLGDGITLGDLVVLGNGVNIENEATLGNKTVLDDMVRLGRGVAIGDEVVIGNRTVLGNCVTLGTGVALGSWVVLGDEVVLGKWAVLGNGAILGNRVKLRDHVILGDGVRLSDGVTSAELAEVFRQAITGPQIFWKWVTQDRMSPNFDGGTPIEYRRGAVVVAEGTASDQQCAPGLHVLRIPYRPEWVNLCGADHKFIPLRVEVQPKDILFAGLPTQDAKLRVRRLKVLD